MFSGFVNSICLIHVSLGKSTLLRHIAMREVPIPTNISILFVEQEVGSFCGFGLRMLFSDVPLQIVGDDTLALESVLKADVWRDRLMAEEKQLNVQLAQYESIENPSKADEDAKGEAETRLAEVHANLADIEAESGPARASQLLSGK